MIVLIIISLVLLEELIEILYRKTNKYKLDLGDAAKLLDVPDEIEICNVGSGPGVHAISYEGCRLKGFNFSTSPQNFWYGFQILKHFSKKIKKDAIIIVLILCPMSFGNNSDVKRKNYSDRFYGILNKNEIFDYSIRRYFITRHIVLFKFVHKFAKKIKSILVRGKKVKVKNESVTDIWIREFNLKNLTDENQALDHKCTFFEKEQLILDELNYCEKMGWKPVLVIPPVPQETRNNISQEFKKHFFDENMEKILKKHPVKLLDYYDDERIEQTMFLNDIFLNDKGKEFFSKLLFEDLQEE